MATKKLSTLIKEARLNANMTQEQLARRIPGLSANDISLAERGKMALTQAQLKQIAKATGVTQASLINAAKGSSSQKKSSPAKSSSSSSKSSITVTSAEKKLVELYRAANSDTKKAAINLLKGEDSTAGMIIDDILDSVQDILNGK